MGSDPPVGPQRSAAARADGAIGSAEWRVAQIREWLLLLRFAITHDPGDQAAVLAVAGEIDSLGPRRTQSAPSFFRRTSSEVCQAITTRDDPKRNAVLAKHLARIDDLRLRRAFQAAIGFDDGPPQASSESKRQELWAGLPR